MLCHDMLCYVMSCYICMYLCGYVCVDVCVHVMLCLSVCLYAYIENLPKSRSVTILFNQFGGRGTLAIFVSWFVVLKRAQRKEASRKGPRTHAGSSPPCTPPEPGTAALRHKPAPFFEIALNVFVIFVIVGLVPVGLHICTVWFGPTVITCNALCLCWSSMPLLS